VISKVAEKAIFGKRQSAKSCRCRHHKVIGVNYGRIIGIDLGTTNSVVAYWNRRRPKPIMNSNNSSLTPSVVAVDQGSRYVGQDAKDRRYSGSKNIAYSGKALIGRDYDDPESKKHWIETNSYPTRKPKARSKLDWRPLYSPVEFLR